MQLVHVTDESRRQSAVLYPVLPTEPADLAELSSILRGTHDQSAALTRKFGAGSAAVELGAETFVILVITDVPGGGHGVGGLFAVTNWVLETLNPAMGDEVGAACAEPILWPLLETGPGEYAIEKDFNTFFEAEQAGRSVAHCVLISPMDRSQTRVAGVYLNDQETGEVLIPVTV